MTSQEFFFVAHEQSSDTDRCKRRNLSESQLELTPLAATTYYDMYEFIRGMAT